MRTEMHTYVCGHYAPDPYGTGTFCDHRETFIDEQTATQQLYLHLQKAHGAKLPTDEQLTKKEFGTITYNFGWVIPAEKQSRYRGKPHWLGGKGGDPVDV
jgi:hypothetical protein